MNSTYQAALNGTLASVDGPMVTSVWARNDSTVVLRLSWLSYQAERWGVSKTGGWSPGRTGALFAPGVTFAMDEVSSGDFWLLTAAHSGAFAGVLNWDQSNMLLPVSAATFLDPNDIGAIPQPSADVVIPTNSPRAIVGCGALGNGNSVLREQYWELLPSSYSISPGETRKSSWSVTAGMSSTSSTQTELSGSVGVSEHAGLGVIGAKMSASLASSSGSSQSLTISQQSTNFNSTEFINIGDKSRMLLYWQLTDELTIFDVNGEPLSSINTAIQPPVIGGPYDPDDLTPRPMLPDTSAITRTAPTSIPVPADVTPDDVVIARYSG